MMALLGAELKSGADLLLEAGFAGVYATKPAGMPLEEAMKKEVARECVCQTVNSLFRHGLHGFHGF